MKNNPKLIIFDLDGTLIQNPLFYKTIYSQSLNDLIEEMRGEKGLKILSYCRKTFQGRGELALSKLNIPYARWAEKLERLPLTLIKKNLPLVQKIKNISATKVIYTGSPLSVAKKILMRTGFDLTDFDEIIGWKDPEEFPLKWTCSSFVYQSIISKYSMEPKFALAVGDTVTTDLFPARSLGIKTINALDKVLLVAGGNSTLLSKVKSLQQKKIVIEENLGDIEQIGFVSQENNLPKLTMMGNELCINGTLAFASTLDKSGYLMTSGTNNKVFYRNMKNKSMISLKLEYSKKGNVILLPGIGFIYAERKKPLTKIILETYCKRYNLPAFGSISYTNNKLLPLIYVKETNSLIQETACGSGSIASNILLGITNVTQPSGDIISVKRKLNNFSISAKVTNISLL